MYKLRGCNSSSISNRLPCHSLRYTATLLLGPLNLKVPPTILTALTRPVLESLNQPMDWEFHSENPALARKAWWSSLWSVGPCRMKNWPWLKDWLTNHDSSLAGSWTGQCCSKKQVLAHVGCEMLSGKHSTLSWFSWHQGFSGLGGHGAYIWYSSHMLSFPHDITRSTSNTTTIRYETIRMLVHFWKHSGQSSITSTRPVAPPWSNMSGFLHTKTKRNSGSLKPLGWPAAILPQRQEYLPTFGSVATIAPSLLRNLNTYTA